MLHNESIVENFFHKKKKEIPITITFSFNMLIDWIEFLKFFIDEVNIQCHLYKLMKSINAFISLPITAPIKYFIIYKLKLLSVGSWLVARGSYLYNIRILFIILHRHHLVVFPVLHLSTWMHPDSQIHQQYDQNPSTNAR